MVNTFIYDTVLKIKFIYRVEKLNKVDIYDYFYISQKKMKSSARNFFFTVKNTYIIIN